MATSTSIKKIHFSLLLLISLLPLVFVFFYSKYYPELLAHNSEFKKECVDEIWNGLWTLLLGLPIVYFCAYKKPGTRWLTLSVWTTIGGFLLRLFSWVFILLVLAFLPPAREQIYSQFTSLSALRVTDIVISTAISVLFLIYSLKLLRKNKTFQYQEAFKLPANRSVFARFKAVSSEQELKSLTTELKGQFPEISKMIRWKSRLRKKKLSLSLNPR